MASNDEGYPVVVRKRVLALPKKKQKSDLIHEYVRKRRKQRKKWPVPDAEAIFDMHFAVYSHAKHVFHAEMTIEFPESDTSSTFYTIAVTSKTRAGALRAVIEKLEREEWYLYFRKRGVRFRVTGVLEELYRGYL